jgi:hypothetical protein
VRDYGKVHSSFWSSQTMRELSEDGRHLALYLLTCQHNTIAGAFRLPDGYICEDMQWPAERVAKGFGELFGKGFANRCETTKWVYIAKHLEWNLPENPNQWKAARKIVSQIPAECGWLPEFKKIFAVAAGDELPKPANPSETVSKPEAVTGAVTVTGAEPGESGAGAPAAPKPKEPASKGSRLPDDWAPDSDLLAWTKAEFPSVSVATELPKFADYWRGKPGADGRKSDWAATWRNWIRRAAEDRKPSQSRRHNNFENRDYTAGVTPDGTF